MLDPYTLAGFHPSALTEVGVEHARPWQPANLPVELAGHLQNAGIASAVHQPEVAGHVHRRRRVVELRVVEEVEPLGADLEPAGLAQLADGEILVDADIPVVDSETLLYVPPQVAKNASGRRGVCGAIEAQQSG